MRSLAARLFAILLLVTVLIQVLSFGGVMVKMGLQGRQGMNQFLAADLAALQVTLRQQAPAQRTQTLELLNRRGYYMLAVAPAAAQWPAWESPHMAESVTAVREGLPGVPVRAVHWTSDDGTDWPAMALPLDEAQQLVVVFPGRGSPFAPPPARLILLYLLGVSLLVMAVAWVAVRLATQPMARLARAAQALGRNLNAAPLPESGPTEVRDAAQAFNAMQRAIQANLRERTQILASISHDLKTPLTRLRLRVSGLPEDERRARIEWDIDAMEQLIQEGLDYAQSSQLREALVPLDLNALLDSLAERHADMGQDVQLQGRLDFPLRCAPRALERALQNLVDNAVKYGERARIEVGAQAGTAFIRIEDDGPGVPDELLPRLTEPFFRAEGSRSRDTGGTGLGLAIAQNLLQSQDARLVLSNRVPQGLVATVWFTGDQAGHASEG